MFSSFATSSTFDFDAGFPASYAPLSSAMKLEESSFAHDLSQERSLSSGAASGVNASSAKSFSSSSSSTAKAMDLTADGPAAGEPSFGDLWSCVSSSDLDPSLGSSPATPPADSAVEFGYPELAEFVSPPHDSDYSTPSPDLSDSDSSPFADSPALSEELDWSDGSALQHCLSESGVDSRLFPNGFDPHMSFDSAVASGQYPLSSLPCHESVMSPKARVEAELASAFELAPAFELSAAAAASAATASSSASAPLEFAPTLAAGTTGGKVKPKLKLKITRKVVPAPIKLPAQAQPSKKTVAAPTQLSTANKKKKLAAAITAAAPQLEVKEVKMTARQMSREHRLKEAASAPAASSLLDTVEVLPAMSMNPEDNEISIGIYTRGERKAKIARYMEKRARRLARIKKGGYECRSRYAVARPRIGGRFISLKGEAGQAALAEWRRLNADAMQDAEEEEEEISEATMALD